MSYLSLEGTADYLAAYPAIMTAFVATGSISAGNMVRMMADTGFVKKSDDALGTGSVVGVAYISASDGDKVGVISWGYIKNIVATGSVGYGVQIMCSDLGKVRAWVTGSWDGGDYNELMRQALKVKGIAVTSATDGNKFMAFLDCMR